MSDPDTLETVGTPQNSAYNWLLNEDSAFLCPQSPNLIQRYVLAVHYFSTRGNRWFQCSAPTDLQDPELVAQANDACTIVATPGTRLDNSYAWLTGVSECQWGGIACDDDGRVIRIDMENNGVGGRLPFELEQLYYLRFLLLEIGAIAGTIPTQLGRLSSLELLDLDFNLLQGPIPEELFDLTNLKQFDINNNELSGTLSTKIGQLQLLNLIQVESNFLTGKIPDELSTLELLEVATMQFNQLSGSVPDGVCDIASLEVFTVDCLGAPGRPSPPFVECPCCSFCY